MESKQTHVRHGLLDITRVLTLLLLFTPLCYFPYLFFYYSNSKLYFFLAVSEMAFFFFLWTMMRYRQLRPPCTGLSLLVFFYIGTLLVASLLGVNPLHSFWGSIDRTNSGVFWLHGGAVFLILISVFRTQKSWKQIFLFSTIIGLAVTLIFYLSLVFPDSLLLFSRSKGGSTFGNSSFLGTYLIFQIGFSFYLFFVEQKKFLRFFAFFSSVIFIIALFMTTAQAAKLAFLGGCLVFFPLYFLTNKTSRVCRWISALLLVFFTIAFFSSWFILLQPDSQLHKTVVAYSSETRFVLWDIAWQGVKERPLLGWGLENFTDVFQIHFNPCLGSPSCGMEIWFDRAHHKVLDVLVDAGLLGLALYLSLFAMSFVNLFRALKRQFITRATFALLASLLLVYFVQNFTVFDTIMSDVLFLLVLAFIATLANQEFVADREFYGVSSEKKFTFVVFLTAILGIFSFFWFVISPLRGNLATSNVVHAKLLSERIAAYQDAVALSSQGIDLRRSMLAAQTATFILDLSEQQSANSSTLLQKELSLSEAALRETIQQSPFFLRGYLDLSFIYQVWARRFDPEKITQAERVSQQALVRFPNNPLSYWSLVGIYLDEEKNKEALVLASQALALDPSVRASQLRYLLALFITGQTQMIEKTLEEFARLDPSVRETIHPYLASDITQKQQRTGLLFRFYYDASF